jgi:hypothetical protein
MGRSSESEQLKAGKLRALATASRTRIEPLPDVPTVAESGYEDYEVDVWLGLVTPAKTPKETVSHLVGWFTAALTPPHAFALCLGERIVVGSAWEREVAGSGLSVSGRRGLLWVRNGKLGANVFRSTPVTGLF